MASGGNYGRVLLAFCLLGSFWVLTAVTCVFAQGVGEGNVSWKNENPQRNEPWWANRLAPAAESVHRGYMDVDELGIWTFPYPLIAAEHLLAPLDFFRALTWDQFWRKTPEDPHPSFDRPVIGDYLVIVKGLSVGGEKVFWFVLSRTGNEKRETLAMARWIQLRQTQFGFNPVGWSYREELEDVLRNSLVTELKCKTSQVEELANLAARIDALSISPKVLCENKSWSSNRLPGFVFRLFSGKYCAEIMATIYCGEGNDAGNLLRWYREAVRTLERVRLAAEKKRAPGCSLVTENGLSFLEKRPPHPPLEEIVIIKEVTQRER